MTITTRKILKKIGSDKLELTKNAGDGYWYFIYDDKAGKYDTHSVYEMYLGGDEYLDFWVNEGKDFLKKMEQVD